MDSEAIACPECGSKKVWKDGVRYTKQGEIQRYICRSCGHRFSETRVRKRSNLKMSNSIYRQVCAPAEGAKNLAKAEAVLALRKKRAKAKDGPRGPRKISAMPKSKESWLNSHGG